MKRRYIYPILVILGLIGLVPGTYSQDMNYSQYFSTPIYYNPAYTGVNQGVRARFLYRNQWPSLPVSYKSYYFSADLGDRNLPGSGGLGIKLICKNQVVPIYPALHDTRFDPKLGDHVAVDGNADPDRKCSTKIVDQPCPGSVLVDLDPDTARARKVPVAKVG